MTETPTDSWPTIEGDTLIGAPGPPPLAPVPPPYEPPPDRRVGAGMLLALTVIVLALAGVAIAYFLTHRQTQHPQQVRTVVLRTTAPKRVAAEKVAVPRVLGMKEQQALVRLAQLGLRPKEVFRPTRQPKGVVVAQKPQEAAEVRKGTQVRIVVDSGAPKVAMPDVTGRPLAAAQAALDRLGLDSTVTRVTSGRGAGTVVDQAPRPGARLAKGSSVTLSVAQAKAAAPTPTTTEAATTSSAPTTTAQAPAQPQNATVPDVTNQTEAAAIQAMSRAGILASLFFVPGSDPLGTVEQQAKPAGTTVPYHAHVQINVSSGPGDKPRERVPDVIGRTLEQALASINGAHLRLLFVKLPVTSRSQAGKVVQQSPLGGGGAPQNAQVVVFLGAFRG